MTALRRSLRKQGALRAEDDAAETEGVRTLAKARTSEAESAALDFQCQRQSGVEPPHSIVRRGRGRGGKVSAGGRDRGWPTSPARR